MTGDFYKTDNALYRVHGKHLDAEAGWVYGYLLCHTDNQTGLCSKLVSDIVQDLKMTRNTAARHVKTLVKYGLVEIDAPFKRGRVVALRVVPARDVPAGGLHKSCATECPEIVQPEAQEVRNSRARVAQEVRISCTTLVHTPCKDSFQDSSSSTTIDPALDIYKRLNPDRYHQGPPNDRAQNDYFKYIRWLIDQGKIPTQNQMDAAVADASETWEANCKGIPLSAGPLIRALKFQMKPNQEQAHGTGRHGNGGHPGASGQGRPGNGESPADQRERELQDEQDWVIGRYGPGPDNLDKDPSIRRARDRYRAQSASGAVSASGVPG